MRPGLHVSMHSAQKYMKIVYFWLDTWIHGRVRHVSMYPTPTNTWFHVSCGWLHGYKDMVAMYPCSQPPQIHGFMYPVAGYRDTRTWSPCIRVISHKIQEGRVFLDEPKGPSH